jgi:hypothetical protein
VLLSQTVFHVLFVALGATAIPTVAATGHQHALVLTSVPGESVAPDAGMLGAHVVAGILTIAMLWRGEAMLRAVSRWVRAALRRRVLQPRADWPVPASIAHTARVFLSTILLGDLRRRGPPVLSRA